MSAVNLTTSVSKGCFAFKGKIKKANELNYLPTEENKYVQNRFQSFTKQWKDLSAQIDRLRADLNCQMFEDLVTFTLNCHKVKHSERVPAAEIPTAVVLTGVNTPDHGIMFSNLSSLFKARVTSLVARVFPKDSLRISTLISSLFQQLTNISLKAEDINEDDSFSQEDDVDLENTNVTLKKNEKRNFSVSMSTISKWYQKTYASTDAQPSPRKKSKTFSSPKKKESQSTFTNDQLQIAKPHIIIMLEEVENMNAMVLQDFISLCNSYLTALPIVLVLGVATAITAVHRILPSNTSSLMCMETFHAPPASQYLTQLLDRIIMTTQVPFKLGPKVFNFLLDNFLYHDFSIVNFILGFKICMTEHFLSSPLSVLCCPEDVLEATVTKLTHVEFEYIRRHAGFMRYVENATGPEQAQLLTDDTFTKKKLSEECKKLHSFHKNFFPALRFLHCLCGNLPKHPMGKLLRELYSACLYENVTDSQGYKQAFVFLRLMCCEELDELLGLCLKTVEVENSFVDFTGALEKFRYRLKHLDEEKEEILSDDLSNVRFLPQRAKLHELKEKLQCMSSVRKKSAYEQLRDEILNYLDQRFKQLLLCPLTLAMNEVFYFNDLAAVKDHIRPSPRHAIQMALTEPSKLLSCLCCHCDSESILPTMPDLCIVYKLHLECGTLVNLYDWLQAFVLIISSKEGYGSPEKTKGPTTEQHARFIRAVSELQFLGFVKGTRRKTDHVTRLTW